MSSDELKTMLERGVLYDRFVVPDVQRVYQDSVTGRSSGQLVMRADRIVPPQQLRLLCGAPKCEDIMDWDLTRDRERESAPEDLSSGYSALEYRCRHTPDNKVAFFL